MPTLLVNPRLSPELAARIERRIGSGFRFGRRRDPHERAFHRARPASIGRLFPLIALAVVVALYGAARTYEGNALERKRTSLLDEIAARRAELGPEREAISVQVERWAAELGAEQGAPELVTPELASAPLLDARLARPAIYLRGRACDLRTKDALATAVTAVKDAFLLCLYAPPASREQKDVLARLRGVPFGGARLDELTPSVERWEPARDGLTVLGPDLERRARTADEATLRTIDRTLEAAPPDAAKRAARAELLVLVADETDANRSRVALVDLRASRLLLRTTLRHDTTRWPPDRRAALGATIEGCELALHVRRLAADGRYSAR